MPQGQDDNKAVAPVAAWTAAAKVHEIDITSAGFQKLPAKSPILIYWTGSVEWGISGSETPPSPLQAYGTDGIREDLYTGQEDVYLHWTADGDASSSRPTKVAIPSGPTF